MKKHDLMENTSTVYYNSSKWKNNDGCTFEIIGKINRKCKGGYCYYLCEFDDGFKIEVKYQHIKDGQVKNPYFPSVCGIGYLGEGNWKTVVKYKRTKEYSLWIGIINRCYNTNAKDYIHYGDKGVTIDSRWYNFQQFCDDIQHLEGYNKWKVSDYQLDKDILCEKLNIEPKIYSKDTCMFISKTLNAEKSHRTGLTYIAYRIIDKHEEEFISMTLFANKYNLQYSGVSGCIYGRIKQHKGWTFKIKE